MWFKRFSTWIKQINEGLLNFHAFSIIYHTTYLYCVYTRSIKSIYSSIYFLYGIPFCLFLFRNFIRNVWIEWAFIIVLSTNSMRVMVLAILRGCWFWYEQILQSCCQLALNNILIFDFNRFTHSKSKFRSFEYREHLS